MIFRIAHRPSYFSVSRQTAQDNRLSFEARGILFYLLSKCDSWQVRVDDLRREGGCGRDKIYRVLKELTDAGYLRQEMKKDGKGRWIKGDYLVYETPQPLPEKPDTEKPDILNIKEKEKREREAIPSPAWQKAFETHIGLATARDVDFFADLRKRYSDTDIIYAITEARRRNPDIKHNPYRTIETILEELSRPEDTSPESIALNQQIASLIAGSGLKENIQAARVMLDSPEKVALFKEFWREANPIGKPHSRPHARQVLAYYSDALDWDKTRKTQPALGGVHRHDLSCPECDPAYGNPAAIGDGFFQFGNEKMHCPWCWSGVYEHPEAAKGQVIQRLRVSA